MAQLKFFLISLLLALSLINPISIFAQDVPPEERLEGVVTAVIDEKEIISEFNNTPQLYQKLEVLITSVNRKGETLTAESGNLPIVNVPKYKTGDKIVITVSQTADDKDIFLITDYVRRAPLYLLFAIFIILTVLIAGKRGVAALLGMAVSFAVIFLYVLPQIFLGYDPILIAIVAATLIIPVTFYLSHGINKKTTAAIIGTIISLIITGILANVFVSLTNLSGFASEEAGFLQINRPDFINIRGLLLAGIIIGVLGILDDITISQAAIAYQLKEASPKISPSELFRRTMEVGRDHIASLVNTLVLIYTSAAMPLLLLFMDSARPIGEIINLEMVAEEIVRTLVASIGLILAVPITTLVAILIISKNPS